MSGHEVLFGIIVPGIVFLFSFAVTYWLYRHFSSKVGDKQEK